LQLAKSVISEISVHALFILFIFKYKINLIHDQYSNFKF
jgi:hypothetical protein